MYTMQFICSARHTSDPSEQYLLLNNADGEKLPLLLPLPRLLVPALATSLSVCVGVSDSSSQLVLISALDKRVRHGVDAVVAGENEDDDDDDADFDDDICVVVVVFGEEDACATVDVLAILKMTLRRLFAPLSQWDHCCASPALGGCV